MSKYYGKIGFEKTVDNGNGVWVPVIEEREYFGDIQKINRRAQSTENVNDDLTISNVISIVADPYINENLYAVRYVSFMGANWKVNSVEVQYPRLLLTIGGVYNAS